MTTEFHGLFKNGGIGTANTGLALALAEEGIEVFVAFADAYTAPTPERAEEFAIARKRFRELGVMLEMIPRHLLLRTDADDLGMSYSVYGYLLTREFDLVLFNECGGLGYYALNAKHLGLFPHAPSMYVVTHGPSEWVDELSSRPIRSPRNIALAFFERRSVELADVLISPSQYLLDWMRARGWSPPSTSRVIQNLLPPRSAREPAALAGIREIVFFGRQETRKGIELFFEAVTALDQERGAKAAFPEITLLGKFDRVGGLHSGVYAVENSRSWRQGPRIIASFDQAEAMSYLERPGVLAVMPSVAENSPCVVAECLQAGVAFIATDSGGTRELIASEDHDVCLVAPNVESLKTRLASALENGQRAGKLAVPQARAREAWLELVRASRAHRGDLTRVGATMEPAHKPKLSFCVARDASKAGDPLVLPSLQAQLYPDFEIVIVDFGGMEGGAQGALSHDDASLQFHLPGAGRAEARNLAASKASGERLFFVAETNIVLMPDCADVFAGIADRLRADIVTGVPLEFDRKGAPVANWDGFLDYLPIGASVEMASFWDCLGRSAFLIDAKKFKEIGGFQAAPTEAIQDRLLLTKAVIAGASLEVAPKPLFWARSRPPAPFATIWLAQRAVLDLYANEKVSVLSRVLESVPGIAADPIAAGVRALEAHPGNARDIAMTMAFAIPLGSKEGFEPFVNYCLMRERYREAVEFARYNDPVKLMPIAWEAAKKAAEEAARTATRFAMEFDGFSVEMTGEVAERLREVSAGEPLELEGGDFGVASHALVTGLTILKAPAVCPPHATAVEVVAGLITPGSEGVEFSCVVCEPSARLSFASGDLVSKSNLWWSGWFVAPANGDWTSARVEIDRPLDQSLDLFLICRSGASLSMAPRFAWRGVNAQVSISGYSTPSRISAETVEAPLTVRHLRSAEVLTDASDFPFPVFALGPPLIHHPLAGRDCVVRLKGVVFPGAVGVRAVFSLEHVASHSVEFSFWTRPTTEPATERVPEAGAEGFSGWILVEQPFQSRQALATFKALADESMDLYLATRVVGFPDVDSCHASWRHIAIVETANS